MRNVLLAFALLGLSASTAAAEDASPHRSGFWLNAGVGWGSADQNCDNCGDTDRESGLAGQFALGGTLSPQFLIGVESNGWYKAQNGIKRLLGTSFAAVAYYYPSVEGNLFLKGGVGLASYVIDDAGLTTYQGTGMLGGVGYDFPIGAKFSITPVATFQHGILGDVNGDQGVSQNIISIGATFTLH